MKNKNTATVYDVGFIGDGKYNMVTHNKAYKVWKDMLQRGCSKHYKLRKPSYKDVSVDISLYNFQIFGEWFEKYYIEGFVLDKDLLSKTNNKVYSLDTIIFIPEEINLFIANRKYKKSNFPIGVYKKPSGKFEVQITLNNTKKLLGTYQTVEEAFKVYKEEKENHAKVLANKYKNQITEACYQALINYKVEITD